MFCAGDKVRMIKNNRHVSGYDYTDTGTIITFPFSRTDRRHTCKRKVSIYDNAGNWIKDRILTHYCVKWDNGGHMTWCADDELETIE